MLHHFIIMMKALGAADLSFVLVTLAPFITRTIMTT